MKRIRKPRILFYDVENTANVSRTWPGRMYDTNVIKIRKPWEFLSVSWRWAGKKQTHCCTRQGQKTDIKVVRKLFQLFSKADLIIAHNGDRSDYRKFRTRAAKYKMGLPKLNRSVDTLKVVRDNYLLDSYSLAYVCEYFGLGKKLDPQGFDTWEGCEQDLPKAWRRMIKYNKHDSVLVERLYNFLRSQGTYQESSNPSEDVESQFEGCLWGLPLLRKHSCSEAWLRCYPIASVSTVAVPEPHLHELV
jgi:hypothetical protein